MALTKGSASFGSDSPPNVPDASTSPEGADAKGVYGDPADATRMPRMAGIAAEAKAASDGDGASSSTSPAFIDGSTAGGFTKIGGVKNQGGVSFPAS